MLSILSLIAGVADQPGDEPPKEWRPLLERVVGSLETGQPPSSADFVTPLSPKSAQLLHDQLAHCRKTSVWNTLQPNTVAIDWKSKGSASPGKLITLLTIQDNKIRQISIHEDDRH